MGNKEAAGKAAEEAAREKMKRVANDQAKKARRKRAKTQQAAAAVAAKQEEEAEVKAAAEIAMEHSDSTKASKAESPAQIEAKFTRDSAPGLLGWLRPRLLTRWQLGGCLPQVEGCPQRKAWAELSRGAATPLHSGRDAHASQFPILASRRGTAP